MTKEHSMIDFQGADINVSEYDRAVHRNYAPTRLATCSMSFYNHENKRIDVDRP